jgi:hypothetical protein
VSDAKKSDAISNYTIVVSVLIASLISIVNEEVLGGQPLWVRIAAAAVIAGALMTLFLFFAKRIIPS